MPRGASLNEPWVKWEAGNGDGILTNSWAQGEEGEKQNEDE